MEKIFLSELERTILKSSILGVRKMPMFPNVTESTLQEAVKSLTAKGLIDSKIAYGELMFIERLQKGDDYLIENPDLQNPVIETKPKIESESTKKWLIGTIIAACGVIVALISCIVTCCRN